jgi:hypothetical protein
VKEHLFLVVAMEPQYMFALLGWSHNTCVNRFKFEVWSGRCETSELQLFEFESRKGGGGMGGSFEKRPAPHRKNSWSFLRPERL